MMRDKLDGVLFDIKKKMWKKISVSESKTVCLRLSGISAREEHQLILFES